MTSGGGTDVFAGLQAAYEIMDADRPTGIILVSDGVANAGPHNYRDLVGLSAKHDVRIFTFAIGNSANERMLDDIVKFTNGPSASISVHDEIGAHLLLARERMTHTALHGVTFDLPGASVVYPKTMPTLYMGQQLVVVGRYDKSGPSTLRVAARVSGKEVAWSVPVELPATDGSNPELERIYALRAIGDLGRQAWLGGDPGEARGAIVDLAMRYSLVTDYTSMIALKDTRKAQYGIGSHNADRRKAENAAAARRATGANQVRTHTSGTPLAGNRAAHAPTRHAQRVQNQGSSGGGGGSGALGPWHLLLAAGLAYGARRRRKLLLSAAALAASWLPDAFLLTQEGVHRGEIWRLWTEHLVHRTTEHFLFDVGTALLLLPFVRRVWIWALLPPLVGIGTLVLRPELASYAGLSGVLHGAMVVAGMSLLRGQNRVSSVERVIGLGAVVAVLAKATYEGVTHTPLFTQGLNMGGVTVYEAHWIGALVGLVADTLRPLALHLCWVAIGRRRGTNSPARRCPAVRSAWRLRLVGVSRHGTR